jgi:hypothetical protein
MKLKEKECTHRHEVTFSITVIGIGDDEYEVIQDARNYGLCDIVLSDMEVVKVTQDSDWCDDCIESAE